MPKKLSAQVRTREIELLLFDVDGGGGTLHEAVEFILKAQGKMEENRRSLHRAIAAPPCSELKTAEDAMDAEEFEELDLATDNQRSLCVLRVPSDFGS